VSRFVYPRLPLSFAKKRIAEIESALARNGLYGVEELASVEHPRAAPVATGGRVADRARIADVRRTVMQALEPWRTQETVPRTEVATYDLALGRALHESLDIVPADASHDETWNFLTLVVCPDVAVRRFPDMHNERMMGTQRNALRRTWFREEVIGDLQRTTDRPLGEDELVGLFERSALARNHTLVRRLVIAVLAYDGRGRSDWARELYKHVTFATGPRLLDALSEDQLDDLIRSAARAASGGEAQPAREAAVADAISASEAAMRSSRATDPAPTELTWAGHPGVIKPREATDLEARFGLEMLGICQRAKEELNYDAILMPGMPSDEGAVATATKLVMSERLSPGFIFLWTHDRLDLTVEALVARGEFAPLFDRDVVARAEQRLRGYG
jgi:hypothetical protein